MKHLRKVTFHIAVFLLATFSMVLHAQDVVPAAIGTVQLVQGSVNVRAADGLLHPLTRGSQVYLLDTIVTDDDGAVQLNLRDATKLALKKNTELAFKKYEYSGEPVMNAVAVLSLGSGGLRVITGTIGKAAQGLFTIETALANICMQAGTHEIALAGSVLYTGVATGTACVRNSEGELQLGGAGNADYSRTDAGFAPIGLLSKPQALF